MVVDAPVPKAHFKDVAFGVFGLFNRPVDAVDLGGQAAAEGFKSAHVSISFKLAG
jgi:hypothetical protein